MRLLEPRYGDDITIWFVVEYPKSGGTWLSRMVADYLNLPLPLHSYLPVTFSAVLPVHWEWTPGMRRAFYLVRDGRDVMVSYYFFRMRCVKSPECAYQRQAMKRFRRLFGKGFDPDDIRTHLPRFIEEEMERPTSSRRNWAQHVSEWWQWDREGLALLRYEDLLQDCFTTLRNALPKVTGQEVDDWQLRHSVERFSFERMSGRRPGETDNTAFLRKGVAGDWLNHFSPEAAEVFNHYAGRELMRLGYVSSLAWFESVSGMDEAD